MISFNAQNIEMPVLDFKRIEIWLGNVAAAYNKRIGSLNYLFCSDEDILKVNRQFLDHDYYTDIITFDYSYNSKVSGDIYISLETVASNARELDVAYSDELLRVIAHGLLHLCGIDDKGPGEREIMEENENAALALLKDIKI